MPETPALPSTGDAGKTRGEPPPALTRLRHRPLLLIRLFILASSLAGLVIAWADILSDMSAREITARERVRNLALIHARAAGETIQATIERFDFALQLARSAAREGSRPLAIQASQNNAALPPDLVIQQFLIDETGHLAFSSLSTAPRNYLGDRDYFRQLASTSADTLVISPPVLGRLTRKWSIQLARPLLEDGRFQGVMAMAIAPETWTRQLARFEMAPRDTLTLVNGQGQVLLRTLAGPEHIGKTAPPQRDYIRNPSQMEGNYETHASVDGVLRQYAWVRLPSGLVMLTGIALDDALAPVREINQWTLVRAGLFSAVFLALTLTLLVALSRYEKIVLQLGEREKHYRNVVTHMAEGLLVVDEEGCITDSNTAFTAITGFSSQEVRGRHVSMLEGPPKGIASLNELIDATDDIPMEGDFHGLHRDGHSYTGHSLISVVRTPDGRILRRVVLLTDVTEKRLRDGQIWHHAHFDLLTGLPNRVLMQERIDKMLRQARHNDSGVTVLFIDLDHFKPINDEHGHDVGDVVLRQVAQRLKDLFREDDTVCRLGGDEFVVAIPGDLDPLAWETVAAKVVRSLSVPFLVAGQALNISCSLGVARFPADGENAEALISHADQAMYRAKNQGRARWST
ncbi:diguanylate cyclase [Zoogloea sp.]|uniref:bifunctional diguanylate cyclase/phosphodiesterase n=1 Tax=Zoogloea sp. TaxID=49181 RepID=UPI002616B63E|nr:diguanylate cyclase [Zoogloea sp.]MDD3352194.1 diguanylate cyclase [Zoogloea sp.]